MMSKKEENSAENVKVWHIVVIVVIAFGFYVANNDGTQSTQIATQTEEVKSDGCVEAILKELRNPASATIELTASNDSAALYKVRAQNGFGGLSVEQWGCANGSEGKTAFPY